jgi:uncharacterized membrane protein SirB2
MYSWIKLVHIACVGLSFSLFFTRGLWLLLRPARPLWRWLRIAPHMVDTALLASGLTLAFFIRQYPFVNSDWLTAKVIGLIVYITLGVIAFRGLRLRAGRWLVWVMALLVFGYIVSVALSKQPAGFLRGYV